ncbi:MAG: hypothetical protein V3V55_08660, partial [Rhodospirillales bacterium]
PLENIVEPEVFFNGSSTLLGHFPLKFTRYRLRPPRFRHSFLAGGVAPIPGQNDRHGMNGGKRRNCGLRKSR